MNANADVDCFGVYSGGETQASFVITFWRVFLNEVRASKDTALCVKTIRSIQ